MSQKKINSRRYHETLLQWIWDMQHFEHRNLQTECGRPISIENTGLINPGKGPDFLHARVKIGKMLWHGDVEIHIAEQEWYQHNHHQDQRFNSVILHVFLQGGRSHAKTRDSFSPFCLNLSRHLSQPLYHLLALKESEKTLPCSGQLTFISEDAFRTQLNKAKSEYFEFKVESLLKHYPSGEKISIAWKSALITEIYRTLGISGNREAMMKLSKRLTGSSSMPPSSEAFIQYVIKSADTENKSIWNDTGMRPASRPYHRIGQAAAIHYQINQIEFSDFISTGTKNWVSIINQIEKRYQSGSQMQQILYCTVFLPAIYLLGDLLCSEKLKKESKALWWKSKMNLPGAILEPFKKSGFPYKEYKHNPGLAHQLKRYCRQRICHQCEVFKKSIHS
jgi:hypothetical protein